mmetsp:Transcript_8/g.40  ORF Transcript_8/g.40 Transcript_8/m.40 type:complete len:978 (+) Transcript_8:237-3170(+)
MGGGTDEKQNNQASDKEEVPLINRRCLFISFFVVAISSLLLAQVHVAFSTEHLHSSHHGSDMDQEVIYGYLVDNLNKRGGKSRTGSSSSSSSQEQPTATVKHAFARSTDGNFIAVDRYLVRRPNSDLQQHTIAVLGDGLAPLHIEPKDASNAEAVVHADFTCSMGSQQNTKARVVLMKGHKTLEEHYFKTQNGKRDNWAFSGNGDKFRTMIVFCDELEYQTQDGNGSVKDPPLILSSPDQSFSVKIDTPIVAPIPQKQPPQLTAVHCLTPLYGLKEPHWVIEYMEHHLAAGVEHLHIYNYNLFEASLMKIFEEYQRQGVITYHDWSNEGSGRYTQNPTYEHAKWTASTDCLLRTRGVYDYALLGDIDEVWLGDTASISAGNVGSGLVACQQEHDNSHGKIIGCGVQSSTISSVYNKMTSEHKGQLLLRRYDRSEAQPHCPGNCKCNRYGPDPNDPTKKACLDMDRRYAFGRQKYIVNTRDLSIEPRPLFTHAISRDYDEMDNIMAIIPEQSLHVRHYQGHWLARQEGLLENLEERDAAIPEQILNTITSRIQQSAILDQIYHAKFSKGVEWIKPIDRSPVLVGQRKKDSPKTSISADEDGVPVENELAVNIVRGTASLPVNKTDLKFRPGILPVNTTEGLKLCHADPMVYKKHFRRSIRDKVSVAEDHKLIYIMLPKSGSSTARFMMETKFGAKEEAKNLNELGTGSLAHYNVFTFIRDPLSRFFSQYDEAYARTGPWQRGYRKEDGYTHPAAFLFEGFNSYQDYEEVFCPPETRKTDRKECTFRETQENGTLAARFERYVWEYDGVSPFDIHLHLQVPLLSHPATGRALHVDEMYNTTAARVGWEALAKRYSVDLSDGTEDGSEGESHNRESNKEGTKGKSGKDGNKDSAKNDSKGGGVIQGRTYPRRFDKKYVTDRTKQRICELGMLDYCCLNLPLPPPCENLYCRMDKEDDNGTPRIRIQPWSYPQSRAAEWTR